MNSAASNITTGAPRGTLDRIGVVASCACAVHCAVMPFLIGVLPLLGLGFVAEERVEWLLVALSGLIGVASLLPSYFRYHRRVSPLILFGVGVTLIVVGRVWFEEGAAFETAGVVAGALTIAAAHFVNRHLCQRRCAF